ncbi:MAG: hypothetical protein U1E76_19245 [Planctomycetota bacterium]
MKRIVREARAWPGDSHADHRAGKDLLNKVALLSDFGLRRGDPGIDAFAERVLAHRDERGRILNHVLMPKRTKPEWLYDVDGQDPLLALVALGFGDDPRVAGAVQMLIETADSTGGWVWPDAPSPLPCRRFVGGCPYPTLKILRILAHVPAGPKSSAARKGVELLLDLANRRETRYGFGFGARFDKLKYPFVWFDILHVLEAISPFPHAWKDERFITLLTGVLEKADSSGRYTPESVWMEWKGLCFGRKDVPSPWLSLVVHRIFGRDPRRETARRRTRGGAT